MSRPKMLSAREAAATVGVTPRRIQQLARADRIPGAAFIAGVWLIPKGFKVTPTDRRRPGKIDMEA